MDNYRKNYKLRMDNYKLRINNTTTFLAWGSRLTKSISLCLEFYWSYISIDVVKRVINVCGKYLNDKVFTCLKIRLKKLLTAHVESFIVGGISKAFTIIRSALPENRQLLYHIPAQNSQHLKRLTIFKLLFYICING